MTANGMRHTLLPYALICWHRSRARKIRCDSTRPVCNNCTRRNNECEYDAVPKRRGPDKRPGTRQRSCKKRPPESEATGPHSKKRRKVSSDHEGSLISFEVKENGASNGAKKSLPTPRFTHDEVSGAHIPQSVSLVLETSPPHRAFPPEAIYPKVSSSSLSLRPSRGIYSALQDELSLSQRCSLVYDNSFDPILIKSEFSRPIDLHHLSMSPSQQLMHDRGAWWAELLDTYGTTREQA